MTRLFLALLVAASLQPLTNARADAGKVEALLRREMRERRIPGLQAAVVRRGKIVLLRSFGIANLQDGVPVNDESIFPINSCTKAFTGVAVMQLVEEGKIDLASPASAYLEGLPESWRRVTVRQLLTHVSGLPNILNVLDPATGKLTGRDDEEAAWAKVQAMPLESPAGERFSYNQTNYVLLGKIIGKYAGQPFASFFGARQFRAAGMTHTLFGDSRDIIPHMAPSYRYVRNLDGHTLGEERLVFSYAEFPPFRRAASGLNSTAEDVARWLIALQGGRLLKTRAALKTLWTAGAYNDGSPTQWALGWVTKPRPRHGAVIATGGSRAAFFVYPEDDLAVVVLTNLAGAFPEEFMDELAGFYVPGIPEADPVTALRVRLRERGFEHAVEVYEELKRRDAGFRPLETDLNDWAYRMLNGFTNREERVRTAEKSIEPLLDEYFDVLPLEKILIEDTLRIIILSVRPTPRRAVVPTIYPSRPKQRAEYTERLCATLNSWSKNSTYTVQGLAIASEKLGVGVAVLEKTLAGESALREPEEFGDLLATLGHLRGVTSRKLNTFELLRGAEVFDRNRLYLVKPIGQRFWTQTAALNDADEIAGSILMYVPQEVA